jgi:hypothetical protein
MAARFFGEQWMGTQAAYHFSHLHKFMTGAPIAV